MGAPLVSGIFTYAVRREPIALVASIGGALLGEARFTDGWERWAARTRPIRHALGPFVMGHLADVALAVATAAFVDLVQDRSPRRTRLVWQLAAAGVLVGLEVAQAPLGFGTFDPLDVAALALGALVVVALAEGARARRAVV